MGEIGSPLRRAFAHNDYLRDRPLHDALAHGFTTVEADVFLDDGELRVGHGSGDLVPGRTLSSLYLEPLAAMVHERGHIWPTQPVQLLIDVKSEAGPTYQALEEVLAGQRRMLTRHLRVVVSGHVDPSAMAARRMCHATADGRPGDLTNDLSPVITSISAKFGKLFTWDGHGPIPPTERAALRELVDRIHRHGRTARFWGTTEAMWPELLAAGVDQIIADDLPALRDFLLAHDP